GTDQTDLASALTLPTFHGALTPGPETMWLKGQRVTAFAGIGRPQKFFDTVEALGAQLCGTFPFPDHHPYKAQDLLLIDRHCAKTGSIAVTTEKDAVRLPVSRRGRVSIVRVDLTVEDSDALIDLIMSKTGFVNE
ncbi:MAG: tetraacyldisaccharide 4'-kinase, partial [Alphaproteobacteria bacterium]